MFVDPNQINPYEKIFGSPKNEDFNHLKSMGILFRTILRIEKIERIYGTKKTNRKEKF
jgi:hypothetical protein